MYSFFRPRVLILWLALFQAWSIDLTASDTSPERLAELQSIDQALNHRGRQPNSLFLGSASGLDLENPSEIFAFVFSQLEDEQWVFPTEDHLYFRFFLDGTFVWGNIHLAPTKRALGKLVMPYYLYRPGLKGPEDTEIHTATMGLDNGLTLEKMDALTYRASFEGKQVTFKLNNLSQEPPAADKVADHEIVLFKLQDESNLQFHLLFDAKNQDFYYVLHEEYPTEYPFVTVAPNLILDQASEFVFYIDKQHGDRKILAGVKREHIRANDYYDGPADQLADNFIADDTLKQCVELTYPYTRGRIGRRATFGPETRVAIAPYYAYSDINDVIQLVEDCEASHTGELLPCVAPDFQKMVSRLRAQEEATQAKDQTKAILNQLNNQARLSRVQASGTHMSRITWHYAGATSLPPGGSHMGLVTWHQDGGTFLPPGGSHMKRTTWHVGGATFLPPGGMHMGLVTWHQDGGTFLPPGGSHMKRTTWHVGGATFLPVGGMHMDRVTWHMGGATFLPVGGMHMDRVTWHQDGGTFLPPGGSHMKQTTWHVGGATFLPIGGTHMSGTSWHKGGATFLPVGGNHMSGVSWHVNHATFLPPGSVHMSGISWHHFHQTFLPPGGVHISGVSWHRAHSTFLVEPDETTQIQAKQKSQSP